MSLEDIKCDGVDLIPLALYRNQQQTVVTVVMKFHFMIEGGYFD
jgi:hypothetical protein